MNIEPDPSCPRVYVIKFGESISGPEWDEYLDFCSARLQEGRPVALIHDHRKGGAPNALQRKKLQDLLDELHSAMSLLRASAIVSRSAIVRGALTALTWLRPLPYPVKVFSTVEDARDWCAGEMGHRRAG